MKPDSWQVFSDSDALARAAAHSILALAARSVHRQGSFHVALPGGTTPVETFRYLRHAKVDWSEWQIFFGDERCLPAGDPERNDSVADRHWLQHVKLRADQIHRIPAELGPDRAAHAYATAVAAAGRLDLVLLGLGEDGHTASLFPGAPLGDDASAPSVLSVTASPKLPRQRVSMSARSINAADTVLVLASGGKKANAVAGWCRGDCLPISAIRPSGTLDVMLTADAAGDANWPTSTGR